MPFPHLQLMRVVVETSIAPEILVNVSTVAHTHTPMLGCDLLSYKRSYQPYLVVTCVEMKTRDFLVDE